MRSDAYHPDRGLPSPQLRPRALLPYYVAFQQETGWGDAEALKRCLRYATAWSEGNNPEASAAEVVSACERVTPDTEDFNTPAVSRALDAAVAAAYAVEACADDNSDATECVAQVCWEAADGMEWLTDARTGTLKDEEETRQRALLARIASGGA